MGAIFSHFRKKIPTKEKLKKIQEDITSLEEYRDHTEQRRKKLVGSLVAYSIVFYLLAAVICYFYYLPPTFEERLLYATPFAGFIILIYFLKRILTSYYRWKVQRNENKLVILKEKKEEILNQVMETETYKVAKDILETFAPEQIRKVSMTLKSPVATSAVVSHRMPLPQSGEVRRRIVSPPAQNFASKSTPSTIRPTGPPVSFPYARPHMTPRLQQPNIRPNINTPYSSQCQKSSYLSITPMNSHGIQRSDIGGRPSDPPGPPMPRPILPRERGILDRFVEYLVGDGPSNRYALICRQCETHNGMALKDEFPYIAFRCAYCHYWNPARKQKPAPPRLEAVPSRISADMSRMLMEKEQIEESSSDEEEEDTESDSTSDSSPSSVEVEDEEQVNATDPSSLGSGLRSEKPEEAQIQKDEPNPGEESNDAPLGNSSNDAPLVDSNDAPPLGDSNDVPSLVDSNAQSASEKMATSDEANEEEALSKAEYLQDTQK